MTCQHCCDADKHFDNKTAVKQMNTFLKKGVTGTTKKIVSVLDKVEVRDKQMIDIGGGIGALQWYFLKRGGKSTVMVEASSSYLQEAKKYAKDKWSEEAKFIQGDFNDVAENLENADLVSLDKVVCCYPDYERILTNSISRTNMYLVLSYPISNWISRTLNKAQKLSKIFKKSEFSTYIHPVKKMRALIEDQGLQLRDRTTTFPWIIELYQKG